MPTQQNWFASSDKPAAEAEWEWLFCLMSSLQLAQEPANGALHELWEAPESPAFALRSLLSRLPPIRVGPTKKVDAA